MFSFVEDVAVAHDAGEDVPVREERPFGDLDAIASHLAVLGPLVDPAHKGVDLKSEAPAGRVLVIEAQKVDVLLLADILPLGKGLVEDGEFWEVLSYDFENGGLATADVSLDRDEARSIAPIFWRHDSISN